MTLDPRRAWETQLHTFAAVRSEGRWKRYRHLEWLCRRIQTGIIQGNYRAVISMPPRHGKSETISHWLPAWFLHWHPWKRVMLASYEAGFAADWGRKVRDHFVGEKRGAPGTVRPDASGASRWILPQGGGMVTAGVGGPLTGRGGDLLILDDPHKNWDEAKSEAKLNTLRNWWQSTFLTRREPGASVIVVATRWHDLDHIGWLLSEFPDEGWDVISLPAIAEENDVLGRSPGEPLCAERYPLEALEETRRDVGSYKFSAMFQQEPVQEGESIWDRSWWRTWKRLPDSPDIWLQSWDLAFKDKKSSDYVVGQVWCAKGSNAFLVDQVRGRMNVVRSMEEIRRMSQNWPQAGLKLIEDKANGPAVMDMLRGEIGGIVPVEPYGNKLTRAMSVQPYVEAGDVWLPDPSFKSYSWVNDFVLETHRFPYGKNDDQVDAASQALRRIYGKMSRGLQIAALI